MGLNWLLRRDALIRRAKDCLPMSDDSKMPNDSVSRDQQIDALCDAFESAWVACQRPSIEELLAQADAADRDRLLSEILPIDIVYRLKNGDQPRAAEYLSRFPALDPAWIEQSLAQQGNRKWKDIIGAAGKLAPSSIEHDRGMGPCRKKSAMSGSDSGEI